MPHNYIETTLVGDNTSYYTDKKGHGGDVYDAVETGKPYDGKQTRDTVRAIARACKEYFESKYSHSLAPAQSSFLSYDSSKKTIPATDTINQYIHNLTKLNHFTFGGKLKNATDGQLLQARKNAPTLSFSRITQGVNARNPAWKPQADLIAEITGKIESNESPFSFEELNDDNLALEATIFLAAALQVYANQKAYASGFLGQKAQLTVAQNANACLSALEDKMNKCFPSTNDFISKLSSIGNSVADNGYGVHTDQKEAYNTRNNSLRAPLMRMSGSSEGSVY